MRSNAALPADYAAACAKAHPDAPAPLVRPYGGRFEIQEGWGKRTLNRQAMLAEISAMFVAAATGVRP